MVLAERFSRSALNRALLNRAILTNKYWYLPVDNVGHEDFVPVGRGNKTSDVCGRFVAFKGCTNVEGHKGVSYKGMDCTGKAFIKPKHWWCHKPTCSVCFNRGWSVRESFSMVGRLDAGVKRGFGKVEHISVSVPANDYNLSEEILREKCRRALLVRGVIGGGMIFHGFRIHRKRNVLYWAVHYHCLGFIMGGYSCRDCKKVGCCSGCDGFEGRTRREREKDGLIVKVLGERKTVGGTAWYQLNHATVRVGIKRFHSVTWFGVCANRKFKSAVFRSVDVCPLCSEEMDRVFVMDGIGVVKNIGDPNYKSSCLVDAVDKDGRPNVVGVVDCGGGGRCE